MKWINVLELCAEGGSIALQGHENENGTWSFKRLTNESAMADLLSEEDAKGLEFKSESKIVEGLDNAIEMLNVSYPNWANLYPTELYEEFSDRICKYALSQKSCNRDAWEEYLSLTPVPTSVVKTGNLVTRAFKSKTEFKIVTYNLRQGGNDRNVAGNHWRKVIDKFSPDLVLAQETRDPLTYFYDEQNSLGEYPPIWELANSKWGSAILSTQHKLTSISVPEFKGWVVGARIAEFSIGDVTKPLFVFCIHTPSIEYFNTVTAILDCIKSIAGDSDILIGGDFNITTAVRHSTEFRRNYPEGLAIIERLRTEFGLINAWQAVHPNTNLPQTLRHTRNKELPYHVDGIFIPISWLRYLESCEVVSEGWSEMSDHNPIVATFNVQPGRCT